MKCPAAVTAPRGSPRAGSPGAHRRRDCTKRASIKWARLAYAGLAASAWLKTWTCSSITPSAGAPEPLRLKPKAAQLTGCLVVAPASTRSTTKISPFDSKTFDQRLSPPEPFRLTRLRRRCLKIMSAREGRAGRRAHRARPAWTRSKRERGVMAQTSWPSLPPRQMTFEGIP